MRSRSPMRMRHCFPRGEKREEENRRFGELLVDWIATGSTSGELMPVEQVIERVIGPLAAEVPFCLSSLTG